MHLVRPMQRAGGGGFLCLPRGNQGCVTKLSKNPQSGKGGSDREIGPNQGPAIPVPRKEKGLEGGKTDRGHIPSWGQFAQCTKPNVGIPTNTRLKREKKS